MNPDKTLNRLTRYYLTQLGLSMSTWTSTPAWTATSPTCSSPGAQTLAALKHEDLREKGTSTPLGPSAPKPRGQRKTCRKTWRIMREEFIDAMPWTRTFVSGPVDRYIPSAIHAYCQFCKCNASKRAKGLKETLRHHATERHLRKDQRWR